MLWVPRGFLHAFCVPITAKISALFEYFCDNVYDKASETGVSPASLLPNVVGSVSGMMRTYDGMEAYGDLVDTFAADLTFSEKDKTAPDYGAWMENAREKYEKSGKAWYR